MGRLGMETARCPLKTVNASVPHCAMDNSTHSEVPEGNEMQADQTQPNGAEAELAAAADSATNAAPKEQPSQGESTSSSSSNEEAAPAQGDPPTNKEPEPEVAPTQVLDSYSSDSDQADDGLHSSDDGPDEGSDDWQSSGESNGEVDSNLTEVEPTPEPEPEPEPEPDFEFKIANAEIPSFRALREARSEVFASKTNLGLFNRELEALGSSSEEQRRRGLGHWILGQYDQAGEILTQHQDDTVAAFTLAKSLMLTSKYKEAAGIFSRLSQEYPDMAPPRAGMIEAQLEIDLAGASESAAEDLEKALDASSDDFHSTAEGHYMRGRLNELHRDFEHALDDYNTARTLDPTLRENLFRGAYLAERSGLDYLATQFYEQLVQEGPIDAKVLMNLGVLYEDNGRHQDAAACFATVSKFFPEDKRARLYLEDARSSLDMYYDEDLERKEDRLNQILRIPITDFELSVRARNCLNKMDINTLGDLVGRTEQELLSYKNFGETSLAEIKEILHSKGLRLGMPREEAVASVELNASHVYTGENADVYNKAISELRLSIRARRTVEALGCLTIGDVIKHSADELLGMPNFGVTSLQELRAQLTEMGLKLRGD